MTDEAWIGPSLERIDEWERGFADRAAQAKALAERTSRLSATAREADGLVEVTVGSNGQVTELKLDDRIRAQPASVTARQILATIATAKSSLAQRYREAASETVGADTSTGRAVIAGMNARLGLDEDELPS